MKIKMLFLSLVLAISAFAAAPQFFVEGSTSYERDRIVHLENQLNFTKQPMVSTWEVTILSEEEFDTYVQEHDIPTGAAYTYLSMNHTYVNEGLFNLALGQGSSFRPRARGWSSDL